MFDAFLTVRVDFAEGDVLVFQFLLEAADEFPFVCFSVVGIDEDDVVAAEFTQEMFVYFRVQIGLWRVDLVEIGIAEYFVTL